MSKEGTVTINLDHYNELRDYKEKIENGHTYLGCAIGWGIMKKGFISTDRAIEILTKDYNELLHKHEKECENNKIAVDRKIKSMSLFQFIKLKFKDSFI